MECTPGAADERKRLFEQGIQSGQTKRTIDQEEELAYARGASESKKLFEQGFQGHSTRRTIDDDEELAHAKGASDTRKMFEQGAMESTTKRYIDEENFHGSRTVNKMTGDTNGQEYHYETSR